MYTDEDLTSATKVGIFTEDAVSKFRMFIANENNSVSVDEENFRLINGFNDIFVVIACVLMLISVGWIGTALNTSAGPLAVALTSWGLTEFFVLRRKMALPAIVLLASFIGSIAWFAASLFHYAGSNTDVWSFVSAALVSAVAARLHWLRFKVPITVAAGVAAITGSIVAMFLALFPETRQWANTLFLIGGVIAFYLAMYWDAQDTQRLTSKSDVAFWLHLLAAPLIVHPIFSMLGVFEGKNDILIATTVIFLYIILAIISIAIDRRALMVSALLYVLFSITTLLNSFGIVSLGFAITNLAIGASLLLLSAYWHTSREILINYIPRSFLTWLPPLR